MDRSTAARSERPNDYLRQNPVDWDGPVTEVLSLGVRSCLISSISIMPPVCTLRYSPAIIMTG